MTERLTALAQRVRHDEYFLASAMAEYARSENLEAAGLAMLLNCSSETLDRLRLCRRPRSTAHLFQADVDRIATRFGIRAETLAEIVRRADALLVLRSASASEDSLLAAARDRDEPAGGDTDSADEEPNKP